MDIKNALTKKLNEIYKTLKDYKPENQHIGVLAGVSGVSLFQFYYARLMNDDIAAQLGTGLITKSIESINNGYVFPTFCSGIAGVGWTMDVLSREEFIDSDNDELLSSLDSYLFQAMNMDIQKEYFDFLHGAMGYGYYFLKRYENTNSEELKDMYKTYLITLINGLQKSSIQEIDGSIWWQFDLKRKEGIKGGNLSLSHGISSIINFLSRLVAYEDFRDLVSEMIHGAIKYVMCHKKKDLSQSAWYPSWILDEVPEKSTSRLAWCYGDLGIAISLWKAGNALTNKAYKKEALEVFKHATKRKDLKEASIHDAGFCHGACGVAHIYNVMYLETGEQLFKETADFWMDQLLKMAIHEDGDAGYKQWRGDLTKWQNSENLLEGIAGIGLTMIAYLDGELTNWDECLLIR